MALGHVFWNLFVKHFLNLFSLAGELAEVCTCCFHRRVVVSSCSETFFRHDDRAHVPFFRDDNVYSRTELVQAMCQVKGLVCGHVTRFSRFLGFLVLSFFCLPVTFCRLCLISSNYSVASVTCVACVPSVVSISSVCSAFSVSGDVYCVHAHANTWCGTHWS